MVKTIIFTYFYLQPIIYRRSTIVTNQVSLWTVLGAEKRDDFDWVCWRVPKVRWFSLKAHWGVRWVPLRQPLSINVVETNSCSASSPSEQAPIIKLAPISQWPTKTEGGNATSKNNRRKKDEYCREEEMGKWKML